VKLLDRITPPGSLGQAHPLWLLVAGVILLIAACGGGSKGSAAVALTALPAIALTPADLAGAYTVQNGQYLDDDAHAVSGTTKQYRRTLARAKGATQPADLIIVTVSDDGVDAASDFIDSASDKDTGPPNLQAYIAAAVPGASDVRATPVDDFPSDDNATVANQLTWQENSNGVMTTEFAYGVYVRQAGLLAFVALRAAASNGGEPSGLRAQAEQVVKRQADKLKQTALASASPVQ
jgi:hypothetical protein